MKSTGNRTSEHIGPWRIVVVDDHPIIRNGLAQLLGHEDDLQLCGEAESMAEALSLVDNLAPDLAIIDLSLKGAGGLELIKALRKGHPRLPILVFSMHDEALYAERCLRAGARGYIMKHEPPEKLIAAVRCVLTTGAYLSPAMASRMLTRAGGGRSRRTKHRGEDPLGIDRLTDRELEIFERIGQGESTNDIAARLFISVKTVQAHRLNIRQKLGLKNVNELLNLAIRWIQK